MKFLNKIDKFSPLDITLFIVFIIYIIFPVATPDFLAGLVSSPLGMLIIFVITIFLFLYTNPTLAILYIFVAYELLLRSNNTIKSQHSASYTQPIMNMSTQQPFVEKMTNPNQGSGTGNGTGNGTGSGTGKGKRRGNGGRGSGGRGSGRQEGFTGGPNLSNKTLEEEVVQQMAPLGGGNLSTTAISSSYQPICEPVGNASLFCAQPNR